MKKIIIAIVAVFAMSTAANAQLSGIGVRLGGGQGYNAELSTLWNFGNRVEIDLGWGSYPDKYGTCYPGFSLTGIYQWQGEFGSGFGWFAGVGARLEYSDNPNNSPIALGLAGQAGLQYQFSAIPIQLSLDIRPAFYLIPGTYPRWGDIAFGIRYMF